MASLSSSIARFDYENEDDRAAASTPRSTPGFRPPPAAGTNPEKLQFMGDGGKTVGGGQARFHFPQKTFFDFHHGGAPQAYQVMVMAVVAFMHQLKPRRAIAKIKPFDQVHLFEEVHGAIDRGQIAPLVTEGGEDFLAGDGMRLAAQNFQNGVALPGDFPRVLPQPAGQRGHFLPFGGLSTGRCFQ